MKALSYLRVLRAFVVKSSGFSVSLADVAKGGDGAKSALW
jgi:hypothetical protein